MYKFSLVKQTNYLLHNARMFTTSVSSASGGWGRSHITVGDTHVHEYNTDVNFRVSKEIYGNISILFDYTKPILKPTTEMTIKIKISNSKKDELEIIRDAPVSHYTYS